MDALSQTLPASWRGIPFPVTSREVGWGHDLAHHKIFKKPVDNVEMTGRNSREFSFEIPFRNGILPGPNEDTLRGRILFPDLYVAFVDAFNEDTAGDLVDPMWGKVNCKPGTIREVMSGDARDGVVVRATFVESDDTPEGNANAVDTPAAISGFLAASDKLDNALVSVPEDLQAGFISLAEIGALLRSPFDTLTLLSLRFAGLLSAVSGQLDALQFSIEAVDDIGFWSVQEAINDLRNSIADIQQAGQAEQTKLRMYMTPVDMTLAQILSFLRVDFDSIVQLNPTICDGPIVYKDTPVMYSRAA